MVVKLRTCKYYIRESFKGFFRNKFMSLASVTSVTATLLVIGIFIILALNVDFLASSFESQVELKVFLVNDVEKGVINTMKEAVASIEGVSDVVFESKEQALESFKTKFEDNSYLLEGLEDRNPLPDSFIVTLVSPNYAEKVSGQISSMINVERVFYGREIIDKLLKITTALRTGCVMLISILFIISTFIISNTIKLTVFARRREIAIMKVVGATDWFVRWPFIIEGVLIGVFGSLISILILAGGYFYCIQAINESMLQIISINLMPFAMVIMTLSVFILCMGVLIGIFGSLISVRRFLKV